MHFLKEPICEVSTGGHILKVSRNHAMCVVSLKMKALNCSVLTIYLIEYKPFPHSGTMRRTGPRPFLPPGSG
jgi:hypothetical protein